MRSSDIERFISSCIAESNGDCCAHMSDPDAVITAKVIAATMRDWRNAL